MNLRILEYFLVVAELGNITKASEQLLMTQPTLSRQLRQLEDELEISLFIRKNHHIELTLEGVLFRRRAQEIVNLAKKAKDELTKDTLLSGELVIGCGEVRAVQEVSELVASFHNLHKDVRFRFITGSNAEIRDGLERGEIDFGLLLEPTPKERYDYVKMKIKEQWGILVDNSSSFAQYEKIIQGDLVGTPVITINDRLIQKDLISWAGATASNMTNFARYDILSSVLKLARVTKAPLICLRPTTQLSDLKFIPLSPQLEATSILAWQSGIKQNQLFESFKTFIQEEYKK